MKLKYTVAAAIAALMLASCGSTGSSGNSAAPISPADTSSAAAAESAPGESTPDVSDAPADSTDEPMQPDNTVSEAVPADDSSEAEEVPMIDGIEDTHIFDSFAEQVTFSQLKAAGMANTLGDGKAYALPYSGGGAGNVFYDLYYTTDAGKTWEKGEPVSMFNGKMSRIALDDGRLLILNSLFATEDLRTEVYAVSCSEDFKITVDTLEYWFNGIRFNSMVDVEPDHNDYSKPNIFKITSNGGTNVTVELYLLEDSGEETGPLAKATFDLDPDSLMPQVEDI
ncbi:MAG: exo-alpha-sialidase [Ruminococcus sp.]|nr:exo-alpha-sialidase [Ruminococcus sp.]